MCPTRPGLPQTLIRRGTQTKFEALVETDPLAPKSPVAFGIGGESEMASGAAE
jgi:hypothetical protein